MNICLPHHTQYSTALTQTLSLNLWLCCSDVAVWTSVKRKMEFVKLICPSSPYIWDGRGISKCFDDLVLGFGVSVVTLVVIAVVALTEKNARKGKKIYHRGKLFLHLLPAFGAGMSCFDIILLQKEQLSGNHSVYHEWLFICSHLLVWAVVLLISMSDSRYIIFSNWMVCIWWILKPFFRIPCLQTTFSSSEDLSFIKQSFATLVDILFGILVNNIRVNRASLGTSLIEESLLSSEMDIEDGCHPDAVTSRSFFHLMTFKSVDPIMERGIIKQLDFEDLLHLPIDMDPLSCHYMLLSCWQDQQRNDCCHPSLFRTICYAYGWPYFRLGLLKVLNDCIGFVGPLLLNKLIWFLQKGSQNFDGYLLAISLGLTSILKSFLDTQYTYHLSKLKLKLRSGLMTIIFRKCLCVSLAERSTFSEGEIQTFMSVDADRTINLCNSFHDMWSLPLQIGIALYLLYTQVKFAFLSGLTITILLIPVNKWIAELIAKATKNMMEQKDERIRRSGELLTYLRTLKIYGWELLFASWLKKTRALEMTYLSTRKYLDAWCVFFWATTPTLFSMFTFGLYALMGNQLDSATVFTCLALFNNLISPLNSFPWVINGLIDAVISTRRLSKFLCCSEHNRQQEQKHNPSCSSSNPDFTDEDRAIAIKEACCAWSNSDEEERELVLDHVTLAIPKGSLVAVIGEVGSGKSSLLNSILGEMKLIKGSIYASGSIAYVPQVPWILSGSVRDNVLFGKHYEPRRYSAVLEACALGVDVSQMVGGDMAYIGEKGVNLSGGQRARLALARAVYHGSDLIMLDDVLSAVDAQVACWILSNAILGPFLNQQTRVLCTHNVQAISSADVVVLMDKGRVKWMGPPAECSSSYFGGNSYGTMEKRVDTHMETQENEVLEVDSIDVLEDPQDIIEVEVRKEGRVETSIYKDYAAFAGWFITVLTCISAILMQASRNGNDLWLSYWVDTTGEYQKEYPTSFYLVILCIFCILNSLLTLVRAFSFAFGGLRAAAQVHNKLLQKLVDAPVTFFDQTPSARILNRLSSDLYTIDDSLPFILNILLANLVGLLGIAIVLSYVQVIFVLLLLPFWYIYRKLQFCYRSASRELRRLDSVSRSPIYASFSETLAGSSTIRAFNSEDFFETRFTEHVTMYQRTSYSEITASLWLSLRLQLLAAFLVSFVALMAVIGSHGHLPFTIGTPGLVGLALSYAAPIVSLLGSFLTSFAETEKEMVAVERVFQYMGIPEEELHGLQQLDPGWPFEGQIEFQNVKLKYLPSLPPALNDLTLIISGGTQVGIVGRTGAGKSSILNVIFRLNPICRGHILVDGINIADVPVRDLRSRFAVVPQTPFLFEGSLRDNLDPFRLNDDMRIWEVLEKCHVKDEVKAAGGLEIHVKESRASFSVGQRQLICLARAFLKSTKVLCLDECTANVDTQTASKLQTAISNECRGMTVITIAHRISTVLYMDKILILDQGILVEEGNPQVLLQDEFSRFSTFAKASSM